MHTPTHASLFTPAVTIRDGRGFFYTIEPLTHEVARTNSERLLSLHSLIPLIEPWSSADLLSDGAAGRPYPNKWKLSGIIRSGQENEIVGVLIAYLRPVSKGHPFDAVYVHRLAIDDTFQRQGVGTAAMAAFIEQAFERIPWLKNITVQVSEGHPAGNVQNFYEGLGFTPVCDIVYPTKLDHLLLRVRGQSAPASPLLVAHPRIAAETSNWMVYISTTNQKKAGELGYLFGCYNVSVGFAKKPIELTEPQVEGSNPVLDVALVHHPLRLAARFLENKTALPFIVEDTMLYIEFFNRDYDAVAELPGYDTKRWWRQLGVEGVINLMGSTTKRRARYVSQIGAYTGKGRYIVGRGEVSGVITTSPRTSNEAVERVPMTSPWFFHSIFQPTGSDLTLAEMGVLDFANFDYKRRAVEDFLPKLDVGNDSQLQLPYVDMN